MNKRKFTPLRRAFIFHFLIYFKSLIRDYFSYSFNKRIYFSSLFGFETECFAGLQLMNMLDILFAVIGSLVLLWMFHDTIWTQPPFISKRRGKADQPVEYNLKMNVSSFQKFLKP